MADAATPHIPVLLDPILKTVAPVRGVWLDGTFGAGGYTRGLLDAGADLVIGVDRDPSALAMATWAGEYGSRLKLVQGNFSDLDIHAGQALDGIVLDLGVSSMQLDQAERGFSFMKDGPLDMRMGTDGPSAADLVASMEEGDLANVLYVYGEERASRRIAKAIVLERAKAPITTTRELARIVESQLPRAKPGQSHPATRSFQAIRIAVNNEFGELGLALQAAERALKPGGQLAVVSFHSLEDRIVKQFLQNRAQQPTGNRHLPEPTLQVPTFTLKGKSISADDAELAQNPRARSARLRIAIRTDAPPRADAPPVPTIKARRT
ncbi:MAG: 16S rRNA (cytosine(1402)-N(4))-methyltransferase RsmH [Deltaproteobacteria bacterium]